MAVVLGFFIVMLDTTIVNVALPDMAASLNTQVATLQWVVDSYTLVFAALLLTAGAACDRIGARKVYILGLVAFGVLSIACALAPTGPALIIARALQGIGAAAVVPGSLALLATVYPDPAERSKAIGLWGGAGGIASACGPVFGGLLVSAIGWQAVFWVNVPIIAFGCWLTMRSIGASAHDRTRRLDPAGQVISIAALVAITYSVITSGEQGWSPVRLGLLLFGVVLVLVFVWVERRHPDPMLPIVLFRKPRFTVAALVGFALNVSFFGQLFVLSLYFQTYRGYDPLIAGLALAPQACSAVIASPLGGRVAARIGPFPTMLIGLLIGTVGFGSLIVLNATTPYPLIAVLSFIAGFGMAFTMPAATSAAVAAAPPSHTGVAGGVINAARQTGSIFGIAVLGAMIAGTNGFLPGFHQAVATASAVFAVAAALVVLALLTTREQASNTPTG
ncbi:MFS transporter [Brevibacterium linens]|uniref:MFS transporter n=1 Tax=Brevibacterium linens TaxID=1703 RepID=UPI000050F967|nr:MFS transporter [Brevibacterium linens]